MNERTHIDLFTGLGGFSLAARANGVRTVAQCECEEFLAKGLETIWQVPVCRDVNLLLEICKKYVRLAGEKRLVPTVTVAGSAIPHTEGNGENATEPGGENLIGTSTGDEKPKSSPSTVENVSVAESQWLNFFAWTISETMAKKNEGDTTSLPFGKSQSSEGSHPTIKSSATTATTPEQSTEYVHINSPFLLTAGVPCQPASRAGRQRGEADNRWFWPQTIELCKYLNPCWALFENPPGIADVGLDGIIAQVAGLGYEIGVLRIPACAVDSPQDRDRFWIVAGPKGGGQPMRGGAQGQPGLGLQQPEGKLVADTKLSELRISQAGGKNGAGVIASRSTQSQPLANGAGQGHQERPSLAGNQGDGRPAAQRASEGGSVADGHSKPSPGRPEEPGRRPEGRIDVGRDDQSGAVAGGQEQPQRAGLCAGEPGGLGRERSGDFVSPWSEFEWVPMPNRAGEIEIRRAPTGLYELAYGIPSRLPGPIRSKLIAALGNAIVWKVAAEIIKAMIEAED